MKGASDEPKADAMRTFLLVVPDAMITRSLSTLILSVVVVAARSTDPNTCPWRKAQYPAIRSREFHPSTVASVAITPELVHASSLSAKGSYRGTGTVFFFIPVLFL